MPPLSNRYPWLDLIRFLAAFLVFSGHLRASIMVEYQLLPSAQKNGWSFGFYLINHLGHEAVLVFFVLSGYLVGGKIINQMARGYFDGTYFVVDRVTRIFPPLLVAIILAICTKAYLGFSIDWYSAVGSIFAVQGVFVEPFYGPLWSLSYETWFYFIIASLAWLLTSRNFHSKTKALIFLSVGLALFTKLRFTCMAVWLLGALARGINFYKNTIRLSLLSILMMFPILRLQISSNSTYISITQRQLMLNRDIFELLFGLFFSLFIAQLTRFTPSHSLTIKIEREAGKLSNFSYTLFLVHAPLIWLLSLVRIEKFENLSALSVSVYLCSMIAIMLFSYLIYYFTERRTVEIKSWLYTTVKKK